MYVKKEMLYRFWSLLIFLFFFLSGCTSKTTPEAIVMLSGTVASGKAVSGLVTIVGSTGKSTSTSILANGKYSANVNGLQTPYIIKAKPDDDTLPVLYSYANEGNSYANITPLTSLALFLTTGDNGLNNLFVNWPLLKLDASRVISAQTIVNANLQNLIDQHLGAEQAKSYDFFRTPFEADNTGIDAVLDAIEVDLSNNKLNISINNTPNFVFDININTQNFSIDKTDNTAIDNSSCHPTNIPAEFSYLAGDYLLAAYISNNQNFPIGDLRTEYLFSITCEGVITVFDKNGNTNIYNQQWKNEAGNIAHSISGPFIQLKDNDQNEPKTLIFRLDPTTGFYLAEIIIGDNPEEEMAFGGAAFSSDPTIRGNAVPQELLDLVGTHRMAKLDLSQTQFDKAIDLVVDNTGTVIYGEPGAEPTFFQDWNVRYGRVKTISDSPPAYNITLHDGFISKIDIYYDAASSGVYYAENVSVRLYGNKIGDGSFGYLTFSGADTATLGTSFYPGRPVVSDMYIDLSRTYRFSQYTLNKHLIELTVRYNQKSGFGLASIEKIPTTEFSIDNFCAINCIVVVDESEKSITFNNIKISNSLTANGVLYY